MIKYNEKNGITPQTITKSVDTAARLRLAETDLESETKSRQVDWSKIKKSDKKEIIKELKAEMKLASENWQFEKATLLRDQIYEIEKS
jgi:excinuclease ABC subunit B